MSMYHFSDAEAVEHDVNTVPDSGDFERVEIDGQWYVPERTCRVVRSGEPSPTGVPRERRCSECGGMLTRFGAYCHNCGAKVVDE